MIKHILKQLWHKRRSNAWIFLELILVTFFMWGVIDPVYIMLNNKDIPFGYDINNVLKLSIGEYPSTHSKFSEEQNTDSMRRVSFLRIYDLVRQYPGVEAAVVIDANRHPLSKSISNWAINYDTLNLASMQVRFYQDGDYFKVFRVADVYTGKYPDHHNPDGRMIYLTQSIEKKLSPDGNSLIGKNLYTKKKDDSTFYKVAGIVPNHKYHSTEQPQPTDFMAFDKVSVKEFPHSSQICFRIRDGLSDQTFMEEFKQKMTSRLAIGNLYFQKLTTFKAIQRNSEFEYGITNKLRLHISLAVFFLICTFLGIAGTFWLRSDSRKGEIGLRMALGSSRKNIIREFLTESWLLTTIAWLIGIFFVLQRVYFTGFASPVNITSGFSNSSQSTEYLQNIFATHFLIVSFIVYILMLIITIIGTWIPARQASTIHPSEALREE